MENPIPASVMDERLQRLQQRLAEHSIAFNRSCIGKETRVLIEKPGRKPGQMIGKSPWLQSVHLDCDAAIGDIIDVTLIAAGPNSMAGAISEREAA